MPKNIYILYLVYSPKKLKKGLEHISSIITDMFQDISQLSTQHILIDTAANEGYIFQDKLVIPGDNLYHEFSGWDTGIQYLNTNFKPNKDDIILFANDSFYTSYGHNYLTLFSKEALMSSLMKTDWALGYMDDFPKQAQILNKPYKSWIRSNFFMIPYHIVEKLGSLTLPLDEEDVFGLGYSEKFWSNTPLISDNFKAYISSWLFGTKNPLFTEYQLNWDRCQPLTKKNYPYFKKKAMTILSEHYLTARLNDYQVTITNVNPNKDQENRHVAPYYENQL